VVGLVKRLWTAASSKGLISDRFRTGSGR
jgi:hypothetical protein